MLLLTFVYDSVRAPLFFENLRHLSSGKNHSIESQKVLRSCRNPFLRGTYHDMLQVVISVISVSTWRISMRWVDMCNYIDTCVRTHTCGARTCACIHTHGHIPTYTQPHTHTHVDGNSDNDVMAAN